MAVLALLVERAALTVLSRQWVLFMGLQSYCPWLADPVAVADKVAVTGRALAVPVVAVPC